MVSAPMLWTGENFIHRGHIPEYLEVADHSTGTAGLEIGAAAWHNDVGYKWEVLTISSYFHLGASDMPDEGDVFVSKPVVDFAGHFGVYGIARLGIRLKQTAYKGAGQSYQKIGERERRMPRIVNSRHGIRWWVYYLPSYSIPIPSLSFSLDRAKPLLIDVQVRFTMYFEQTMWGFTPTIAFHGDHGPWTPPLPDVPASNVPPFKYWIPQWSIVCDEQETTAEPPPYEPSPPESDLYIPNPW